MKGNRFVLKFLLHSHFLEVRGCWYTQYEGPDLANQINRKLGAFDRKLEGSHSKFIVI